MRIPMRKGLLVAVALVLFGVAAPSVGRTQTRKRLTEHVSVVWKGGVPWVSYTLRGLLGEKDDLKLRSGLPQNIVVTATLQDKRRNNLAGDARTCRVLYDLWGERYRVTVSSRGKVTKQSVKTAAAARALCLRVKGVPMGRADTFRKRSGGLLTLVVRADFNPISKRAVRRIRRWLARPNSASEDAFFGSFVQLFVNRKIGKTARTLRYRSAALKVP